MALFIVYLRGAYERTQYELKLVASDSLNENQTTIVISVRDVNDLPPVFPQTLYERSLNEEMAAPYTIIQVAIYHYMYIYYTIVNIVLYISYVHNTLS